MIDFKLTLTLVIFLFGNLINAQNTSEKYLVSYLEKRISSEKGLKRIDKFPNLLKERMLKQINEGEEKFLFIDNYESVYSLKKMIKRKETVIDEVSPEETIETTSSLATTEYFKKSNDSLLVLKKNIGDDIHIIKTNLYPFEWKLIDEAKEINSINCKKATTVDDKGNEIEAWYTEDIPIYNGPSIYGGLPGLIIQLKTKNRFFNVQTIEKTNTEEKIDFPSTKNSITMEEFKIQFNSKNDSGWHVKNQGKI
ncbi:hypothetical protein BTO05_10790 [Winogradskyella sp. PC-19]|uniref:GLPGLI family protein n=1 Tax=unclassified Winogradskyella TaxID=2615021 RepID=UPI000B583D2E|nr:MULTISPECIES: GLPGLI family protein [unclassified Winogradskyella]ARV10097.1 hypothetical protein BTO05_10790 [Winogradskyella sp. PC-19]